MRWPNEHPWARIDFRLPDRISRSEFEENRREVGFDEAGSFAQRPSSCTRSQEERGDPLLGFPLRYYRTRRKMSMPPALLVT